MRKQEGNIQDMAVLWIFSKFRKVFIYVTFKVAKAHVVCYSF